MSNISPEHLAPVISAFPNTKFDLLHGGDPFYGTMALMGAGFPNVYVNMSTMANTCYADFEHWLSVFLDRVPTRKISVGWDEFAPELIPGNAWHTRNVIAEVWLKLCKIEEPIAKGLAIGTGSHALGTTKAMEIGQVEGAMSSLSIVVAGIMTVIGISIFGNFI